VRVGADLVLEHLELDGLLVADAAVVAHGTRSRPTWRPPSSGASVDEDAARLGGRADDAHADVLADVAVDGHGGAEALEVGVLDELAHVGPVEDDARRVHAVHVLDPLEGDARADRVAGGGARVGRAGVAGGRGRVVAGARLAGGAGRARGGERHAGDEVADAGTGGASVGTGGGLRRLGHARVPVDGRPLDGRPEDARPPDARGARRGAGVGVGAAGAAAGRGAGTGVPFDGSVAGCPRRAAACGHPSAAPCVRRGRRRCRGTTRAPRRRRVRCRTPAAS
jgi:hypothetical protein